MSATLKGRPAVGGEGRMAALVRELKELEARLREGGGPNRVAKQHADGKLTAR